MFFCCRVVKELECAKELNVPIIVVIDQDLYQQVAPLMHRLISHLCSLQRSIIDLYTSLGFGYIFSLQVIGYRYITHEFNPPIDHFVLFIVPLIANLATGSCSMRYD